MMVTVMTVSKMKMMKATAREMLTAMVMGKATSMLMAMKTRTMIPTCIHQILPNDQVQPEQHRPT